MTKNGPLEQPNWANFWPKILISGDIYGILELKIHPKVGYLRQKTKPKHILNNSQTTLKKSRKRLFRTPNWPKITPHNGQNEQMFDRKLLFPGSFTDFLSWKTHKSWPFKAKRVAWTLPKQLPNNFEKVQNTTFCTIYI